MKNIFFSVLALSLVLFTSSCKKNEGEEISAADQQLQSLTGDFNSSSSISYNITDVTLDGASRTERWDGTTGTAFVLTLSTDGNGNHSYSTTGGPVDVDHPWPASGTWTFGGTEASPVVTQILREAGTANELPVSVTINTDATPNTLTLTLTYDPSVHLGREAKISSVTGNWVFSFEAQ